MVKIFLSVIAKNNFITFFSKGFKANARQIRHGDKIVQSGELLGNIHLCISF